MATLPERPDFEAGYQAVYDSGALTHDVYRNAAIWHAVQAALKAALPSDAAIKAAKAEALTNAADEFEFKQYTRDARTFGETGTPYANGAKHMEGLALRWMRGAASAYTPRASTEQTGAGR